MAGIWFDDMEVGLVIDHPIRRTVTETDNVMFSFISTRNT